MLELLAVWDSNPCTGQDPLVHYGQSITQGHRNTVWLSKPPSSRFLKLGKGKSVDD